MIILGYAVIIRIDTGKLYDGHSARTMLHTRYREPLPDDAVGPFSINGGVEITTPTWGLILSRAWGFCTMAWWLATFPGLAIMLTVLSINFLGDGGGPSRYESITRRINPGALMSPL